MKCIPLVFAKIKYEIFWEDLRLPQKRNSRTQRNRKELSDQKGETMTSAQRAREERGGEKKVADDLWILAGNSTAHMPLDK